MFLPFTSHNLTLTPSRWLAAGACALALALAGCGSNVKLDDVPVSDRTGTPVGGDAGATSAANTAGAGSAAPQSQVAGVQVGGATAGQPPANLARVVYFDYNSFTVKSEAASVLEGHARYLNANKARRVALEGHTDERGGREFNLALGQKRAEAVRRSLTLLGVSDAQLEAVSFGKEKPANAAATEEAFAQNRRVELSYR